MPDRIADHYERHAHAFDRDRRRSFVERPWIERFVMPLSRGGAILDLGCGGGEPIGRYLVDHGFAVTGIDSSAAMIGLARTRFPRQRWLQIDMRKLTIEDRFEGVLAWGSLFHLEHDDQETMIARIATWLKPGGRLLFNSGPKRGTSMGEYRGDPLYHASLDPAEYRAAFLRAGLVEMAHVVEDPGCGGATVWLARKV
ncbi:class I SAM-dependent methyltransferase [Sphingomonas sp. QA11]|uniref:class I SAM-dependent methyltransferase n=1 Tax=Sphingomonas sp. QA11 TaxID=2950605 RepID=UPI002349407C|nr:class I SAM-dependent methyltransferase [Sphingomonas sp. QA11]WCM27962.1 class I SAM-dependent methyltransferase [Sphingomonas sp. QA11]